MLSHETLYRLIRGFGELNYFQIHSSLAFVVYIKPYSLVKLCFTELLIFRYI